MNNGLVSVFRNLDDNTILFQKLVLMAQFMASFTKRITMLFSFTFLNHWQQCNAAPNKPWDVLSQI